MSAMLIALLIVGAGVMIAIGLGRIMPAQRRKHMQPLPTTLFDTTMSDLRAQRRLLEEAEAQTRAHKQAVLDGDRLERLQAEVDVKTRGGHGT